MRDERKRQILQVVLSYAFSNLDDINEVYDEDFQSITEEEISELISEL